METYSLVLNKYKCNRCGEVIIVNKTLTKCTHCGTGDIDAVLITYDDMVGLTNKLEEKF